MVPSSLPLVCTLAAAVCLLGCGGDADGPPRARFNAQKLDAIDAALERLGAGRWVSWTMELAGDALELRVELAEASEEAQTCTEIDAALKDAARAPVAWHAELRRGGDVVGHCAPADVRSRA